MVWVLWATTLDSSQTKLEALHMLKPQAYTNITNRDGGGCGKPGSLWEVNGYLLIAEAQLT